jgi:hypothetical protein
MPPSPQCGASGSGASTGAESCDEPASAPQPINTQRQATQVERSLTMILAPPANRADAVSYHRKRIARKILEGASGLGSTIWKLPSSAATVAASTHIAALQRRDHV